ncbi:hypothetical protein ZWY2020_030120 [Hordeum vulgare]|nr:hypothetical protein ZWY2020_030120 [Hordeum vulgare]
MAQPTPCRVCKSRCATSLETATLFGIYFQTYFVPTTIVPCNVRLDFDELITWDTVIFDSPEPPYTMEVNKGRNITHIGGDEWGCFIARMYLTREDDDPLDEALFAQRMTRPSEDEMDTLWGRLPPRDAYVKMPFVTRLTRTMVNRHVMRLCESCGIELDEEGIVGLRLTTRGSVATYAYAVDMDGHTIFNVAGWTNFLTSKNFRVGHVILVTIRNTPRHDLRMMIVFNIL